MWTNIKRIARSGVIGFFRNAFVSFATMLVMTVTLFVIGSLIFMNAALNASLDDIRSQVDVNAYFLTTAPEGSILELKSALEQLPEVDSVEYISRDKALEQFKERHQNDQLTLQALEELNDNPLGASLAIRAKNPSQYEAIAKFLENKTAVGDGAEQIIEKVNYHQNKAVIDRLSNLIDETQRSGLVQTIILIIASILIAFNTIRLAIYTNRDEIEIMQLVGASYWFVRGPFIIEGALYGLVSGLLVLCVFYPLAIFYPAAIYPAGPITLLAIDSFDSVAFYINHFGMLFEYIVGSGIVLGAVSSFLAVRRYLGV